MRFPQTFIDDLRRQADIVRIVQDYVTLKKTGANWSACCPFHKETKPSFSVSPSKEIFYCFGCGKGGSVFNFVMEIEHVPFPEAVKIVAQKSNVPLPALKEEKWIEAKQRESAQILELNNWALSWWELQLQQNSSASRRAREYLQNRGIEEQTLNTFKLGYAPDSWDSLISHLKQRGASQELIESSGLVVKKDGGGIYDRFRGRIIFPVFDSQGRAVAFGGRAILPETEPKYLNSPETAAYRKGRHLFGLYLAREDIKQRGFAILVEGYLDLIVPYQFGIRNVVASLGTALTPEQAKLLKRFARKVVVNYDGDRAGLQAAKRAVEVLLSEDFEIKVLVLPDNADPDDFIRSNGVEAYEGLRQRALPHIQFVIDHAVRDRNLIRPADKAEAVEDVLPFLRVVRNPVQKREYFDLAMSALRIGEAGLRNDLWRTVRSPATNGRGGVKEAIARSASSKPTIAEQRLLKLLLTSAEIRQEILPRLEPEDFELLAAAEIFRAVVELNNEPCQVDYEAIMARTDNSESTASLLASILIDEEGSSTEANEKLFLAKSCFEALRLMRIERQLSELSSEINEAFKSVDGARLEMLEEQRKKLEEDRKSILQRAATA